MSRPQTLVVAVVAADEGLPRRVAALLRREGVAARVEAVSEADFADNLDRLDRRPHVVVLGGGADIDTRAVRNLQRGLPSAQIVILLPASRAGDARSLLTAGASGVVLEPSLDWTLALVVRAVEAGLVAVPRELRLATALLGLLTAGLTNDEIASRLFLAESTVKGHLTSAFRRLGVRSRREAVAAILTADESARRSVLAAPGGVDDPEAPRTTEET
jgi:DNA-binding NarL/FixJ family response regulator